MAELTLITTARDGTVGFFLFVIGPPRRFGVCLWSRVFVGLWVCFFMFLLCSMFLLVFFVLLLGSDVGGELCVFDSPTPRSETLGGLPLWVSGFGTRVGFAKEVSVEKRLPCG